MAMHETTRNRNTAYSRSRPLRSSRSEARLVNGLLALIAVLALTPLPSHAQMVIDEIVITAGPAYLNGLFTDFFIAPLVLGDGISSVSVTSQSGILNADMVEVEPGEFGCDGEILTEPCENFASLAAVTALGNLTFVFVGDFGETDSEVVPLADWNPGAGQGGFPQIVSPTPNQSGISASPVLSWQTPPAWVQVLSVGVEDVGTGESPDNTAFQGAPVSITSWAPTGLESNRTYDFELSFFDPIVFQGPRLTNDAAAYVLTSAFASYNHSFFTVPEPGLSVGLSLGSLVCLYSRRRRASEGAKRS